MISLDELSEPEIYILESLGTFGIRSLGDFVYTSSFSRRRISNALEDLRSDGLVKYNTTNNDYQLTAKGNRFVLDEGLVTV